MTYGELQTAVQFGRFKDSQLGYVKTWLATRYARIWTAFEWSFKVVEPTTVTCVIGSRYLGDTGAATVLPADFGSVRSLYDDQVSPLHQLEAADFDANYLYGRVKGLRGRPEAFTVINRRVILGPVPDVAYSFTLGYKRLLSHRDTDNQTTSVIVAGPMSANTDAPIWPSEHHEVLVVGAQALGLKLVADPEWQALEQEHDDLVVGMLADSLLHDELDRPRQYARDSL